MNAQSSQHPGDRLVAFVRQRGDQARDLLAIPRAFDAPPRGSGLKQVHGTSGLPILGVMPEWIRDPIAKMQQGYDRYGPVFYVNGMGMRFVFALGPDESESVLVNKDKAFASGPAWGQVIGPFFHRGLMLLDFDEHHRDRRIMQEAFTPARLRSYVDQMNPAIDRGLKAWQPRDGFLVLPAMRDLMLELATEIFLGEERGPEADRINQAFIDAVRAGVAYLRFNVPGGRWSRGLAARQVLEDYFTKRLPSKRTGDGQDLFSALCHVELEDGQRFSDADIVDQMIFLLLAAFDTTTITMTSMIYQLARHPEWQERVRRESVALGKPHLDFDELAGLTSLDLVMKEALRLVPPVPGMFRRAVKDTEIGGHFIPKGTSVVASPTFVHRMRQYWPDPETFDPERFAEGRREDRSHKYAWQPFGGGVHKCIGLNFAQLQIKATLHQMLLQYRWSVAPGYETAFDYSTLPVPKDRLPVRLERIS